MSTKIAVTEEGQSTYVIIFSFLSASLTVAPSSTTGAADEDELAAQGVSSSLDTQRTVSTREYTGRGRRECSLSERV